MQLSRFGVWTTYRAIGEANAAQAAQLAEELGFGAFWLGGSPRPEQTRPLLAASERMTVATGIVNIWQHEPGAIADEHARLTHDFPDRFLLGIGAGHPEATSDWAHPLRAMAEFFDGLDRAPTPVPVAERCAAALGPHMLDLAARRSLGAHPYFVVVEHTRAAREQLGDGPLIAVEVACVLDTEVERARATARGYAALYLGLRNYTRNLRRFGFDDADFADGGSDRLIDSVVPHGSADDVAAVVHAHLQAGADHVCLQPVGVDGVPRLQWGALAAALIA